MRCLEFVATCCGRDGFAKGRGLSGFKRSGSSQGLRAIEDQEERSFVREQTITTKMMKKLGHKEKIEQFDHTSLRRSVLHTGARRHSNKRVMICVPVRLSEAEALRQHYERQAGGVKPINDENASEIIREFASRYRERYPSPVAEVAVPPGGRLIVVGDTHGQLQDVLLIFRAHGPPSSTNVYLFNGDIADRGENACEIFFLLMAYFLADPGSIVINRGNHEYETLNNLVADDGGGFFHEVTRKFSPALYLDFAEMMKALSICTVVSEKVFVVHAGLSSVMPTTLDKIRKIPHTTRTMPEEGVCSLTKLWLDLVWSDPQDERGVRPSSRGAGIHFGPDVTRRFFQDNPPINLIIRSHEVPGGDAGYELNHHKRCITLFSASNYCGDSGNKGAVMIFEGAKFPQYAFYEYYAPPLELIGGLVAQGKPVEDWVALGEQLYYEEQEALQSSAWTKEVQKLTVIIVENKPGLLEKLKETTGGKFLVNYATWEMIMTQVLGSDWNFKKAWGYWELGDEDSLVNFTDFLRRFTVVLQHEEFMSFKMKGISTAFQKVLAMETSLEETCTFFDKDGDGAVTVEEMAGSLRALDVNLSAHQVEGLIYAIFRDHMNVEGVPRIHTKDFFSRFASVYKHAQDALSGSGRTAELRLMKEVMLMVSQNIAATPSKADQCMVQTGGVSVPRRFVEMFEELDEDRSGFVDTEELVKGIWALPGVQDVELSNGERITQQCLRDMAEAIDQNNSGTISLMEFLHALLIDDAAAGAADALADNILSILLRHRSSIRAVSHFYDPTCCGKISQDNFKKVLQALNDVVDERTSWTESQIEDLCEAFCTDGDQGKINYNDVFDAFQIVDAASPELGVSIGARRSSDDFSPERH